MSIRATAAHLWGAGLLTAAAALASPSRADSSGYHAPELPSNHALLITVSGYQRSPLPGVALDRETAVDLAHRLGVPSQNIVQLSEQQVTREGVKDALAGMGEKIMPGDKLFVYFSGHGARFFSKDLGQCTESIVMQDMHVITNREFAGMLKPLSTKADKTIVMLDSCHAGGVAQAAASRAIVPRPNGQRPKFSPEASSPECSQAVNVRSFAQVRGADIGTTDHNLAILGAARNNEVAWDTLDGGALTYSVQQCLAGAASDTDHSGALSMDELTSCVQARLDKIQKEVDRQHATLAGNTGLIAGFATASAAAPAAGSGPAAAPTPTPSAAAGGPAPVGPVAAVADPVAMLNDIYNQRDDRWQVAVSLDQPQLKIGSNLTLSVHSQRDGYVYIFYQGSRPDSFYLLFPNQLDSGNAITADYTLHLPRHDWSVTALGPRGTDHLLVLVSEAPRDFGKLALPAAYVSQAGPFEKFPASAPAATLVTQLATLSAAARQGQCRSAPKRDLGIARQCSSVFGASQASIEETE
jgi:hypothetical protein